MSVKPIPAGYHSVTPYLIVRGGGAALEFYKKAFSAAELFRLETPDGKIGHAEIKIGDSPIMLADECPESEAASPQTLKGTTFGICIYVEDCDAIFAQAIAAGGREIRPVVDQFYGDRSGTLADPFGHQWTISTHKEDLTPEEIDQRAADWMKQQSAAT